MDALSLLRMAGALGLVLGLMTAALWLVRRLNLRLPAGAGSPSTQRLQIVERAALDARRSAILLRRDGREHLLLLGPEGATLVERGILLDSADERSAQARAAAAAERQAAADEALRQTRAWIDAYAAKAAKRVVASARLLLSAIKRVSMIRPDDFAAAMAKISRTPPPEPGQNIRTKRPAPEGSRARTGGKRRARRRSDRRTAQRGP